MSIYSRPSQVTTATLGVGAVVPTELGREKGLVLRPEIVSSWQRSASSGLATDHFSLPEHELESKVVRPPARCSGHLGGPGRPDASLILTDDAANTAGPVLSHELG